MHALNLRNDELGERTHFVKVRDIRSPKMIILEEDEQTCVAFWFDENLVYHKEKFYWKDLIQVNAGTKIELNPVGVWSKFSIKYQGIQIGVVARNAIQEAVQTNNKIQTIKLLREESRIGLKEAKDFIEEYWDDISTGR